MKEIREKTNYRKLYEEACNIKIPNGYAIHHIDCDRNNNTIRNLVMLPNELHKEYHSLRNEVVLIGIETDLKSIIDGGNGINAHAEYYLSKFFKVWEECSKYVDYRDYLLGYIPNIHRLNIGEDLCKKS